MNIRQSLCALAAAMLVLAAPAGQAAEYRWLSSWDPSQSQIPLLMQPYIKGVESASKGSIKFNVSGPETVPAFEQLQPVASGAFQFLFTHGAYHFGTTPLLAAIEALGGTTEQRRSSGVIEAVDRHYQKIGLKLIAMPMSTDGGYQIILRKPLTPAGNLQGHKIRGNATYANVIKMLGGTVVTLPPGEVYTALDKGVIDGFAWTNYGVADMRLYEPAKFVLRPAFGFGTYAILANLAAWNKLPPADQKVMLDEAAKIEAHWLKESARLMDAEEKTLIGKGMTVVQMGEAQRAQLKRAWSDGLWDLASQKFKKDVDEIRAVAKAKGID
jgi:TRAP-type C4-dicarboxylate transport system substrate-binding protein